MYKSACVCYDIYKPIAKKSDSFYLWGWATHVPLYFHYHPPPPAVATALALTSTIKMILYFFLSLTHSDTYIAHIIIWYKTILKLPCFVLMSSSIGSDSSIFIVAIDLLNCFFCSIVNMFTMEIIEHATRQVRRIRKQNVDDEWLKNMLLEMLLLLQKEIMSLICRLCQLSTSRISLPYLKSIWLFQYSRFPLQFL